MKITKLFSLYTQCFIYLPEQEDHKKYKIGEKVLYIDESEEEVHEEPATVEALSLEEVEKDDIKYSIKIVRATTEEEMQVFDSYQSETEIALQKFRELVTKYGLSMQPIRCNYSLKGNRAHFLFTAAERVDFREMVKELAKVIKKKIYLRQIGPRDRAKLVGGFGKCGQRCCCRRFLNKLPSVTMETARIQGVAGKGSSKLLGCCGKLLCCLNYECETYFKQAEQFPEEGQRVTLKGKKMTAQVLNCDYINEKLKLRTEEDKIIFVALDEITFKKVKPVTPPPAPAEPDNNLN